MTRISLLGACLSLRLHQLREGSLQLEVVLGDTGGVWVLLIRVVGCLQPVTLILTSKAFTPMFMT
jgi:hypothetical protein